MSIFGKKSQGGGNLLGYALAVFAAGAQFAFSMPTKDEIREAQPLVAELMAPELKALKARTKTSAEVGDAACALAEEAAGDAAKWLLLTGAATYYARLVQCGRAFIRTPSSFSRSFWNCRER